MILRSFLQLDQSLAGTSASADDPWLTGLLIVLVFVGVPLKIFFWVKSLKEIERWQSEEQPAPH